MKRFKIISLIVTLLLMFSSVSVMAYAAPTKGNNIITPNYVVCPYWNGPHVYEIYHNYTVNVNNGTHTVYYQGAYRTCSYHDSYMHEYYTCMCGVKSSETVTYIGQVHSIPHQ